MNLILIICIILFIYMNFTYFVFKKYINKQDIHWKIKWERKTKKNLFYFITILTKFHKYINIVIILFGCLFLYNSIILLSLLIMKKLFLHWDYFYQNIKPEFYFLISLSLLICIFIQINKLISNQKNKAFELEKNKTN